MFCLSNEVHFVNREMMWKIRLKYEVPEPLMIHIDANERIKDKGHHSIDLRSELR
jgi:hypothetical protein